MSVHYDLTNEQVMRLADKLPDVTKGQRKENRAIIGAAGATGEAGENSGFIIMENVRDGAVQFDLCKIVARDLPGKTVKNFLKHTGIEAQPQVERKRPGRKVKEKGGEVAMVMGTEMTLYPE